LFDSLSAPPSDGWPSGVLFREELTIPDGFGQNQGRGVIMANDSEIYDVKEWELEIGTIQYATINHKSGIRRYNNK
jgi:hypothetical protein